MAKKITIQEETMTTQGFKTLPKEITVPTYMAKQTATDEWSTVNADTEEVIRTYKKSEVKDPRACAETYAAKLS